MRSRPWWKLPKYKRVKAKYTRRIKAECKKREPRREFQAACWNYLAKLYAPKMRREVRREEKR